MEPDQDSDLIAEFLQTRSEQVFLQFYRRHTPRLYLFALRLSGKKEDAEDIVQESWTRAIRKLSTFQTNGKFINWLIGIACNCYREMQRSNDIPKTDYGMDLDGLEATGAPVIQLEQLIRMLPNGCREILILHDLYGYTHEETAALLKINAGTSKSQLFEARKKLRAWLLKEES